MDAEWPDRGFSRADAAAVAPGTRDRTLCHAQSSWPLSLASLGPSAGFSASLARSCSVSCSLVGMEFFLGLPLGLVGDSRPPPCSTCAGTPALVSGYRGLRALCRGGPKGPTGHQKPRGDGGHLSVAG